MSNPSNQSLRGRADGCFVVIDVPGPVLPPLFRAAAIRACELPHGASATTYGQIGAGDPIGGNLG